MRTAVSVTLGLLFAISFVMLSLRERGGSSPTMLTVTAAVSSRYEHPPLPQFDQNIPRSGLDGYTLPITTREPLAPPESRPAPLALPTLELIGGAERRPTPVILPTIQPIVLPDLSSPAVLLPTLQPTTNPGFTPAPSGERRPIPILMYHYVRYVDPGVDPLGFNLSVTPEQLDAQLAWLRAAGYETVRMDTLAACVRGEGPCPARAVALTFDDGYLDAYTTTLPLLQRYDYHATFYIVSDFIGQPGYMGWDELRALHALGMELGAHSVSHPDLTTLGLEELRTQVAQSGAILAAGLGQPVRSFCYPAGRFNPMVAAVVAEAGFTSATTTNPDGPHHDPFTLPRLRIAGGLSQQNFQAMVTAMLP